MGADIPDIAGLYLEEALDVLDATGMDARAIIKTAPPRQRNIAYEGRFRVISAGNKGSDGITVIVTPAPDIERLFRDSS
jgi:hypothetical protein